MKRHFPVLCVSFALLVLGAADQALARRTGPPAGVSGSLASNGNNCSVCHSGSLGFSGSVQILNAPSIYTLNSQYDLTVRIEDGVQEGAGFQLSAEDAAGNHAGTLIVTDALNTQLQPSNSGYINHTSAGVDDSVADWATLGMAAEYQVRWQAPANAVGPVTFWAAGNAINNNFSSSNDHVYTTSVTAGEPPPQGACCLPSGDCAITDEAGCTMQNGAFAVGEECGAAQACCTGSACANLAPVCCDLDSGNSLSGLCEGDVDQDGTDGVCGDACPTDANKTSPGLCGCGVSDADADLDTVPDCDDQCAGPDDTIDENNDTIPDCLQFQPIPTASAWGLAAMAMLLLIAAKLRSRTASA